MPHHFLMYEKHQYQHVLFTLKCFKHDFSFLFFLQKDSITIKCERSEADLHNIKIFREEESRKYGCEIEKLNSEIEFLQKNETDLVKNIDELKDNLVIVTNQRNDLQEQNESYQSEIENIEKMLYDETESGSKSASKVLLLTRQLDEEQKRAVDATRQLDEARLQIKTSLMTIDTLKSELSHARAAIQDHIVKV